MYFFRNFERDSIFVLQKLEKETKKAANIFPVILDGLNSRQTKMRFFKGVVRRFKESKFGPGLQKLLKYS